MPYGDGTGPGGLGPMTGGGFGNCTGYAVQGFQSPVFGRGFGGGRGRGGGRGWRNQFYATNLVGWQRGAIGRPVYGPDYDVPFAAAPTQEQQVETLKSQAQYMENMLDSIQKRIKVIEGKTTDA